MLMVMAMGLLRDGNGAAAIAIATPGARGGGAGEVGEGHADRNVQL